MSSISEMSLPNDPPVGRIVRAPKTAELIATQLRRRIVRGELTPGETLPSELQLMEQFGVSRPTLREAFRILETESLLNVRRGSRGGAQILAPDASVAARHVGLLLQMQGTTIDDVYEARMVAEPECARMLAKRRTEQDLADLVAVIEELERAIGAAGTEARPDPVLWSRLTYRFHELVMERSGNRTLAVQGAVLQDIVGTHLEHRVSRNFGASSPERFQRAVKGYRKLVALVEAHDAEGAAKHWRRHMEAAAAYLLGDDLRDKPVVDLFT